MTGSAALLAGGDGAAGSAPGAAADRQLSRAPARTDWRSRRLWRDFLHIKLVLPDGTVASDDAAVAAVPIPHGMGRPPQRRQIPQRQEHPQGPYRRPDPGL